MKKETIEAIRSFVKERDWEQFHTGENLAKSIVIEAGELLELYQWTNEAKSLDHAKEEIADVLTYALMYCDHYGFDPDQVVMEKLKKNAVTVFIDVSPSVLEKRLSNITTRGIAAKQGESVEDILRERLPLYKKYADFTISTENENVESSVEKIVSLLKEFSNVKLK